MKSIMYLSILFAVVAYFMALSNAQDPWAAMGVTCDLETTMVTIKGDNGCSKNRKYMLVLQFGISLSS